MIDEIEEFNKLQQHGSIIKYPEKFESLKTLMLVKNPRLPKDYFIPSFVSGLKEKLKPTVRMMKPHTLMEVFEVAMLLEQSLELSSRKFKNIAKWNGDPGRYSNKATTEKTHVNKLASSSNPKHVETPQMESKKISIDKIQRRQNLGLCFKCGEKHGVGHQCNLKNFSFMIIDEDENDESLVAKDTTEEGDENNGDILDVCLHALTNQLKKNTITLFWYD